MGYYDAAFRAVPIGGAFHPPRLLYRLNVRIESTPPFPGWGATIGRQINQNGCLMLEKESTLFEYCRNWASSLIEIVVAVPGHFFAFYSPVLDPARSILTL
tara:strand:+ start:56362 stop:56664 length:303 start_codon:yes stop_codon:yes gene_type:complete